MINYYYSSKTMAVVLPQAIIDKCTSLAASTRNVEDVLHDIQPLDEKLKVQRTEALKKLVLLLKVWAKMVVYQQGETDKVVMLKHLKLVPFGSYKYDDASKDSDIDLLCVTSRYITRKNFFHDLGRLFEGMKDVEGFTVIMSAFVPILKMKFHGVAMDICFSQLTCNSLPEKFSLNYISTINLDQLDDKSATSLNGYIMTSKIAEAIPSSENFATTLNVIKLWAKRRGIYSSLVGFLGGSSWSVLVAKICQLYPDATPTALTALFFRTFAQWDWTVPVALEKTSPSSPSSPPSSCLSSRPWIVPMDSSRDVMQIMTPLIPSTNTARTVSRSSCDIIRNEFRRAAQITQRERRSLTQKGGDTDGWKRLFDECKKEFFRKYPVYVQVVVGALKDGAEDRGRKWEGWAKSRIVGLVKSLEQQEGVEFAHINTQTFVQSSQSPSEPETAHIYIGLSMDDKLPHPLPCGSTTQFVRLVSGWREFDPACMGVRVDFLAPNHLPNFVL